MPVRICGIQPFVPEIFRQAESRIVINAHRINQGQMPDLASIDRGDLMRVENDYDEEVYNSDLGACRASML